MAWARWRSGACAAEAARAVEQAGARHSARETALLLLSDQRLEAAERAWGSVRVELQAQEREASDRQLAEAVAHAATRSELHALANELAAEARRRATAEAVGEALREQVAELREGVAAASARAVRLSLHLLPLPYSCLVAATAIAVGNLLDILRSAAQSTSTAARVPTGRKCRQGRG
jgi:hypothetical protein